ncbi:CPBP family intramembrane metalloprotease [Natroniella sulfidigena]|uniref:CPBP family intramembrane glutamic endopeptidase n=1 Tax=Natroniella sulfidigena TaxID=723921 RepID=UPI00200A0FA9|nr:type II CAAX endopeptidase family protein [Natroniella sulfidigena]MCK8815886.1 CPBP family intramembrane metalloprotease [Natroniella sulfidigena]
MVDEKGYPSLLQAMGLILLYFIFQLIIGISGGIIGGLTGLWQAELFRYTLEYYLAPGLGGLLSFLYVKKKYQIAWEEVRGENIIDLKLYSVIFMTIVGIILVNSLVINLVESVFPLQQDFVEHLNRVYANNLILVFFSLVIIYPVVEEVIFRGIILRGFLTRYKPWLAITGSTFLFAVLHLNPWQGAATFVLGLFLGWIYFKTNSLLLAIIGHSINNLIVVLSTKLSEQPVSTEVELLPIWLIVLGFGLLLGGIVLINKAKFESKSE